MRPNNWQQTLGNDVDGEMKNIKILENIKKDIEKHENRPTDAGLSQ